jgi:AraC-like DNA-binding protein
MQVGFSSSSYLSHVFLKEVGVTPREYRQGKS